MDTYTPINDVCPSQEDIIEKHLLIPWWVNLFALIFIIACLSPFIVKYYFDPYMYSIIAVGLLFINVFCIYTHEHTHAWVLRNLNDDDPIILVSLRKSYCKPQKAVPLPIFLIDLAAPSIIPGILGITTALLYIFTASEIVIWIFGLSSVFQFSAMYGDLYWIILLWKIPRNRCVICDGPTATVYIPTK